MTRSPRLHLQQLAFTLLLLPLITAAAPAADEPFRPQQGKFPPLEFSKFWRGELVFVDHANRRGSIRVESTGTYFRNSPHPFALLPYAVVRYHGAPADLRDIPLGTVLSAHAFLPPDPQTSPVPVLPVAKQEANTGYKGLGTEPAENHVLLLEDEPSFCLREGKVWQLHELSIQNQQGLINASREPKQSTGQPAATETLSFDAATRIWRGRECLSVGELIAEGTWPAEGKLDLKRLPVLLGLTWKPTTSGVFLRFHISDVWLDDTSLQRASARQTELHKAFIRSRWMPAWVDAVEYGRFGRATVTATLFGGMDPSLYTDFRQGSQAIMNAAESTLKHAGGSYGPAHMASRGSILAVTNATEPPPLGSSGIQIRFETDLIIEGIRPGRVVRISVAGWPQVDLPREEYLGDGSFRHEDRFPTPAIFPKY
jgi:hypothetical protein